MHWLHVTVRAVIFSSLSASNAITASTALTPWAACVSCINSPARYIFDKCGLSLSSPSVLYSSNLCTLLNVHNLLGGSSERKMKWELSAQNTHNHSGQCALFTAISIPNNFSAVNFLSACDHLQWIANFHLSHSPVDGASVLCPSVLFHLSWSQAHPGRKHMQSKAFKGFLRLTCVGMGTGMWHSSFHHHAK